MVKHSGTSIRRTGPTPTWAQSRKGRKLSLLKPERSEASSGWLEGEGPNCRPSKKYPTAVSSHSS